MSERSRTTWQDVRADVLDRIRSRDWKPGDLIPTEVELAAEFGCARATVNRALRAVAEDGLLDRRRKIGTRVARHPVRRATMRIPILRHEIEARGGAYAHRLLQRENRLPPAAVRGRMALLPTARALRLRALHLADDEPYAFEDRWVNVDAVPTIAAADLTQLSANEWLVAQAPFTSGDLTFGALRPGAATAAHLGTTKDHALFSIERLTWNDATAITLVRLTFQDRKSVV